MHRHFTVFAFFAVLAMAAPSAAVVTFSLVPQHGSADCGGETVVGLWANSPDPINNFQLGLTYDESCVNIVNVEWSMTNWMLTSWNETSSADNESCYDVTGGVEWLKAWSLFNVGTDVHLCDITFRCNDTDYCMSNLNFTCGAYCRDCPIVSGNEAGALPVAWVDGTFTCGTLETLNFSKSLYEGWNLISLPLAPVDNNRNAVLATVSDDAVYRYNATSKKFESIGSADSMNTGTGYFVSVTSDCIWEYDGYAYTSMDISLEPGLNMVGWLNCSKDVDELSSISEYYYVARWNAIAERFEVYNPVAPSAFNDFTKMDRGIGYFISAKQDCTLSETC